MAGDKPVGQRAGLDRNDVIDAALALVKRSGSEALTMRRLAGELGVTAPTIYWHVGGRDELVVEVLRRQSERQAAAVIHGVTPRERVMAAARLVWESAIDNREVMVLANQAGGTSVLEIDLERALARELEAADIRGSAARDALRGILYCVGGFLVIALRDASSIPPELTGTALWASVDDPGIDPSTTAALAAPLPLTALFDTTIQAVVDHFVPEVPVA